MKKIALYLLMILFFVNGVVCMQISPEYTFFWWTGVINVASFGGILLNDLFDYLVN